MEYVILFLSIIVTGLLVLLFASIFYAKKQQAILEENLQLKTQVVDNQRVLSELKLEFVQIAKEALSSQQENLLSIHSTDLKSKMELFKSEEITPINNLLKEFKKSIDDYQQQHLLNTQEVKNAISTAEKYAKSLTTSNTTLQGEFGEDWLEQILQSCNLKENIHYVKQYVPDSVENKGKPDIVVKLSNNQHIVIDSKVIIKKYIEYRESDEDKILKNDFIQDLTKCINDLGSRHYENIEELNQPGFILMYIPIEGCVDLIYSDSDFFKCISLANSKNIIIVGSASLIVALRLVNQLWASSLQVNNLKNIISVAENLYNNVAIHAQSLINIQSAIENTSELIQKEINRFTTKHNGSIFKEAEKLRQYGIAEKDIKLKKGSAKGLIPEQFLEE